MLLLQRIPFHYFYFAFCFNSLVRENGTSFSLQLINLVEKRATEKTSVSVESALVPTVFIAVLVLY